MWTSFELAEWFGVNVESVRRWVRKGEIVPVRLGGPQGDRFPESEVQRFIKSKRRPLKELAS